MKLVALFLLPLLAALPALAGVPDPVVSDGVTALGPPVSPDSAISPAGSDPTWRERSRHASPHTSPPAMSDAEMAYDAAAEVVVMFGGSAEDRNTIGKTWVWNGSQWEHLHTDPHPSHRFLHAMAYDPVRDEVVMFGGYDQVAVADTWVFKDGQWSQREPEASPPARYGHVMAFDPVRQQVILFGGSSYSNYFDDTWAWNGDTWVQLDPAVSPSPRWRGRMAYDPTRDRLVLFGGLYGGVLGDTWSWDGATWTQETPRTSPSARLSPGMSTFGRHVVLFGGGDLSGPFSDGVLGDTWVLRSNGWHELNPQAHPSNRDSSAMAWDPVRRRAVLYGGLGQGFGTEVDDTWTLKP